MGGASCGMDVLEDHFFFVERDDIKFGDSLKWYERVYGGREAVVDKCDGGRLVVIALLPLGIALVVGVMGLINAPDAEHLSLKHEVGVAVVVRHWRAIDFYRIEVPQSEPIANVAVVVGTAAQTYCGCDSKDNICCQSFHLKREIAVIEN